MTEPQYQIGQHIQARDPATNEWRDAVVSSLAPYRSRPGYYITWQPLPRESWQSQGGWAYEAVMRQAIPDAAAG